MNIIERFKNQRVSQLIHFKNRLKGSMPSRVEKCFRLKQDRSKFVVLKKKKGAKRAHYSGFQTCGSPWVCPVCSSIISERRKKHLQEAINLWRSKDSCNSVLMITFTTPHLIFQSLNDVLKIQDKAIRIMKKQPQRKKYKVWRTIMDDINSIGSFTGRENTWGQNGWHPHRHECNFAVRVPVFDLKQYREDIVTAFSIAFQKAGGVIADMNSFRRRAVQVDQITDDDGFDRVSSYITKVDGQKWTLAQEATKGNTKIAKNGNITPFGMLDAIRQGSDKSSLYQLKFYEYALTMKGKKQFFPTHGLNHFLRLDWKTDQEIMKESGAGDIYSLIDDDLLKHILDLNIRGQIVSFTEGRNEFEFMRDLPSLLQQYHLKFAV